MPQQDLFKNLSGPAASRGMLEKVTADFPYFSMAQFLLLRKTAQEHPEYDSIAGRTGLHFNNPFYLNYLINKKDTPGNTDTSQKEKEKSEKKSGADELIFEPLYTTDYFASQGIKLSDEIKADDKLGKQLKSFTDWLKTMKKVHDQRLPAGSEQLDLAVQNIAEKSNMEADIITESMADVYISQGKPIKAMEIYSKLSLLNPSKSAYFAAKIELLKK